MVKYSNTKLEKDIDSVMLNGDKNSLNETIKSECDKKEFVKEHYGYNKIMIKNKKIVKKIDGMSNTTSNFFPFGKGEKINVLPVLDCEFDDYNEARKDKVIFDWSKLSPC